MTNTFIKSLHTKFGLFIIPIISLIVGGVIGYSINTAIIKKIRSESVQARQVISDLERDCHDHGDH